MEKTISIQEARKRKLLLVLPVITLPFITFLFYILGGGRAEAQFDEKQLHGGFNFKLPIPKFQEDAALDKMSYYDQAAVDSIKRQEQIKKDPNYLRVGLVDSLDFTSVDLQARRFGTGTSGLNPIALQDRKEQKVYAKLQALQKAISAPASGNSYGQDMREFEHYSSESPEIKNLEKMMSSLGSVQEPDPELQQLGGMLENILDIQHPSRVEQRLKQSSESTKGKIYSVQKNKQEHTVSSLQEHANAVHSLKSNAFYALDEEPSPEEMQNALEAVVHQTQTLVNGSVVKLRLTHDIVLQGTVIPKNTFLFGTAMLKGERLEVKIANIQFRNSIFAVALALYDRDGINGIYIPGALGRDVAKASADRSIQSVGLSGISDSWGAQAAGMGIEAAKSLMSKKVKLIKVVVKAGYQVLLYDEKQKN
ncbi:conjugative transposon protein TraM [Flavobacterium sp. ACN6]|uniref:conjugative transposon protein TraM n=1 Tax=Flavobacterium sp. ACN6 TaxID=1920426 RepID=UPI000BB302D5|nr:conjugative transposon protein TraM [Flavobacterium sp. ACN6]PBJ08025.1 hypothetical protein BSF42_37420 [Flavobacterium sp. ACN6]